MTEGEQASSTETASPVYDHHGVTVTRSPLTGHWIVSSGNDRQGWRQLPDALDQAEQWADQRSWLYHA